MVGAGALKGMTETPQPWSRPPEKIDHDLNKLQSEFIAMVEEFQKRGIHVEFDKGEMKLFDSSDSFCSDLAWVPIIETYTTTLEEGQVDRASCTGSGWLVWSGAITELPRSMDDTHCGPRVATWQSRGGTVTDVALQLDLPWACGAWVKHRD